MEQAGRRTGTKLLTYCGQEEYVENDCVISETGLIILGTLHLAGTLNPELDRTEHV